MSAIVVGGGVTALAVVGAWFALKKYMAGPSFQGRPNLSGKVAIVTGSNTGIGFETAKQLAAFNAHVILACRNKSLGVEAEQLIKKEIPSAKAEFMELDLGSKDSIEKFTREFLSKNIPLHFLVNNAGLIMGKRTITSDGFETTFGVNHLGHFHLTSLLTDVLKKSAPSRIVNVSSKAAENGKIAFDDLQLEKNYSFVSAYSQSKLANVLFSMELAKRLQGTGVSAFSLHPEVIHTEFLRGVPYLSSLHQSTVWKTLIPMKTPLQGAQTTLYCTLQEGLEAQSGRYFSDCAVQPWPNPLCTPEKAAELWTVSEKLLKGH